MSGAHSVNTRRSKAPLSELSRATRTVGVVAMVLAVAGGAAFGVRIGISIAAGGCIGTLNLFALGYIIHSVLGAESSASEMALTHANANANATLTSTCADTAEPSDAEGLPSRSAAGWSILAVLKIGVLFGGVWLLWRSNLVSPLPMVMGYGALPLGLTVFSLLPKSRYQV